MPPTPTFAVEPIPCRIPEAPDYPPTKPNVKKIFVFLDGTGNEFVTASGEGANSNVVKLYTTLMVGEDQVAYYHPGVGTMGDPSIRWAIPRFWSKVKGLAFGAGFKANVLDAYRYLMEVYNDGDQIYIFGFSRGAYTARALASLLHGYGLLCRGNEGHLQYAWRMLIDQLEVHRKKMKKAKRERGDKNAHTIEQNLAFAQTFSRIVTIRFMGVWDTVSSVGWIYTPIRLLDGAHNPILQVGRHAVSIDERRAFYRDNLWGEPVSIDDPEWPESLRRQGIEQDVAQVWFPGAHSDVGGSYPQRESAPANEALCWMIEELRRHGAQLCEDRIDMVLGHYKGGLSARFAYEKPHSPDNKLHDSLSLPWWLLQLFPQQYYDKDDDIVQWRVPFGRPRSIPSGAIVHGSAERRLRVTAKDQEPYRPKNLRLQDLRPLPGPPAETTANLEGCFVLQTPDGKASVADDPDGVRRLKLVLGWLFFGLFWVVLVLLLGSVLALVAGVCRLLVSFVLHVLLHVPWLRVLFGWLYRWVTG